MGSHKFVGTIIDRSYYQPYWRKEGAVEVIYRQCALCDQPRPMMRIAADGTKKFCQHHCTNNLWYAAKSWIWGQFQFHYPGEK